MADNGIQRQDTVSENASPLNLFSGAAADFFGLGMGGATGATDTSTFAGWVADAYRSDPQTANAAYNQFESQLGNAGDLSRFYQDLRAEFGSNLPSPETANLAGNGVFGAGQGLVTAGRLEATRGYNTLVNNPLLNIRWEGSMSPVTGRGGFTSNLETFLRQNGIDVAPHVNPVAPGSTTPSQLVASGQAPNAASARGIANNINGAAAESAIRARYAAQGFQVDPGPTAVQGGQRVVDVTVHAPNAADPRNSQRIEIESKVGRTNMGTPRVQQEIAMDAARLAQNQATRSTGAALEAAGSTLRTAGKIIRPVGVAMDAYAIGSAFNQDGNRIGVNTGRAISSTVGGLAGAAGGAAVGAAIGSVVPVVGTAIGGVVGGIVGGLGGGELASRGFDWVRSWF